jgi:two-component sensor histidine kinase
MNPTLISTNQTAVTLDRARDAHHRIGNNLALIAGLIHLRGRLLSESLTPDEARTMLGEVAAHVEVIAHLHRALSTGDALDVDVSEHLRTACDKLVESFGFGNFSLTYDLQPCRAKVDEAVTISLLVNELVTNAIKYSHPTGIAGVIGVGCRQLADALVIEVSDDGVGLPENFDPETSGGFGFDLVRALREQLNAEIVFDHDCLGLRVRLTVPRRHERGVQH